MSRALGDEAEARAAVHLQRKGYRVLARNWTVRGGELDLVCEDGDSVVFVEVRARRDASHGTPLETVSALKRRRLVRAAELWLLRNDRSDAPCRFDVVAIEGDAITHFEDAFRTP